MTQSQKCEKLKPILLGDVFSLQPFHTTSLALICCRQAYFLFV